MLNFSFPLVNVIASECNERGNLKLEIRLLRRPSVNSGLLAMTYK